jgi:hypothetical protein
MPRVLAILFATLALIPAAAWSANLERLLMPGPVVEGHAELEDDCSACHANFDASKQNGLCLDCHEDVAADVAEHGGFHGRLEPLGTCKRCHTEHLGREADVVGLNPDLFDHQQTDFPLEGAHGAVSCSDCHQAGELHRSATQQCVGCHGEDDPHQDALGDDCAACHGAENWQVEAFDHSVTEFPLRGGHTDVSCQSCHLELTFEAPSECVDCHRKDDIHGGSRGESCNECHSEVDWGQTSFDHGSATGYELLGAHESLPCASCHLDDMQIAEPPTVCNGCHSANDPHQGRNGDDCGRCHDQRSWEDAHFDHAGETGFELLGSHSGLACESCHRGKLTDPLETDCAECHAQDDPHSGAYQRCQDCHTPVAWWEVAFNHDFTDFPLIGRHKLVACESCHVDQTFQGTSNGCFDCHEESDQHDSAFSPRCQQCHNPNGWSRWQFDHDQDTDFVLDGGHTDLECDACHRSNVWESQTLAPCADCHVADDVHEGRFGSNCAECHTTASFHETLPFKR